MTIKSDLFLTGCARPIGVIPAKAVKNLKLFKSPRKLVYTVA